jgi:hypothetical protein
MKYNSTYNFNVSKFISPKDNYGIFEEEGLILGGGTYGTFDIYDYSESSQILRVYADSRNIANFTFEFSLISESNEFIIKLQPNFQVTFDFSQCLYSCDACFYNYGHCNIKNCLKDYSLYRNKDETNKTNCAPNNQTIINYIYNNETNYFEECFQTCSFCSLMKSSSSNINQNCLVCSDGYQKSYEYMGN